MVFKRERQKHKNKTKYKQNKTDKCHTYFEMQVLTLNRKSA